MKLITAKALTKRFRNREVVRGINLEIKQGEILALIGPNGAGKTTTILILIGILMPDAGSVAYWREDYRAHIGVQLQSTPFFEGCTAEENLRLFAAMYRVKLSKTQLHEKLEACNLTEAGKTPAIRLSTGQQKRLAIAVATMHQPDLIVLDEPTAGLDPRARHEIRQLIASLNQSGTAIVFTSHDMEEVSKIAHRVVMGMLIGLGLYFNTPEYHVRLLAGVIGTSALFWALETTVFYILKQRNRGVYKLLRVTPMKIFSFIIALTLAWTVVSLAVATILLIGGLVLFGIRMQFGTLLIFYVTLVTATICFTLISFVVANISKNEGQASIYSNIFAMPMLFLSSAFYSLDTAPTWIKTLSRLNPFSHFVSGLHSTIVFDLRGAAANLFILLAFGVLALIAAILTFRWDSD